jgi:hypothetical protein
MLLNLFPVKDFRRNIDNAFNENCVVDKCKDKYNPVFTETKDSDFFY